MSWQPSARLPILKARAILLAEIRAFFAKRAVLEVETPLLSHGTITDPHIQAIAATFEPLGSKPQRVFLQTSPEYAMKRLLASELGAIYQLGKAFRQDEMGTLHNPEFTLLEWYRPGFDHHALMQEVDDLLRLILKTPAATYLSYQALFETYLKINPHQATLAELSLFAKQQGIELASELNDRDAWLSLLLTHCIEPQLGKEKPVFIYDFPVSQAALAKIRTHENPPVASRFEVYFKGVELANGFHELVDATEQRSRFEKDLAYRKQHSLPIVPIDERFLAALASGLPDCAGVALGVDRLIMLALECKTISDVMSFNFEKA